MGTLFPTLYLFLASYLRRNQNELQPGGSTTCPGASLPVGRPGGRLEFIDFHPEAINWRRGAFIGTGTVAMVTMWTAFAVAMAWAVDAQFSLVEATGARILATLGGAPIALAAVLITQRIAPPPSRPRRTESAVGSSDVAWTGDTPRRAGLR